MNARKTSAMEEEIAIVEYQTCLLSEVSNFTGWEVVSVHEQDEIAFVQRFLTPEFHAACPEAGSVSSYGTSAFVPGQHNAASFVASGPTQIRKPDGTIAYVNYNDLVPMKSRVARALLRRTSTSWASVTKARIDDAEKKLREAEGTARTHARNIDEQKKIIDNLEERLKNEVSKHIASADAAAAKLKEITAAKEQTITTLRESLFKQESDLRVVRKEFGAERVDAILTVAQLEERGKEQPF